MTDSFLLFNLSLMILMSMAPGLEVKHIHTKLGDIVGVVEHVRKEKVYQFRNIPYAKSPVGALRFAKPEASGPWSGTLNATEFGPSCMQPMAVKSVSIFIPNVNRSEDCLLLNIYVPRDISPDSNRSVMVWIHGGAYLQGQGMSYDGSYLALTGDVIVVTINYRLGLFGFLSTPTGGLQGNYGLWDQRLALQWVKDNIAAFGGNPNSVTIFGESAGGFSVSLQAIIPQNQGLFQRVIAQSGNAVSKFAYFSHSKNNNVAKHLGMTVGCADASGIPATYANCMRGKSADDLLAAQNAASNAILQPPSIDVELVVPVVDHDLLQSSPDILLKNKTTTSYKFFQTLDFMTGNVNAEGSLFLPVLTSISKAKKFNLSEGIPTDVFCSYIVPAFVNAYFGAQVNSTLPSDLICSLYGTSDEGLEGDNAIDVYSDAFFVAPAIRSLMAHSEGNTQTSTYQYIFKRPMPISAFRLYPPWWRNDSSAHASELLFLYGLEDFLTKYNINVSPSDISLSKLMLKYWTNFAKTGNPNSDDVPVWHSYDVVQQSYIDLNTTVTSGQHLYGEWINLWLERLPKLFDTGNPGAAIGK